MTTTDYILNAAFVLVVLRQARERELDLDVVEHVRELICELVHRRWLAEQFH